MCRGTSRPELRELRRPLSRREDWSRTAGAKPRGSGQTRQVRRSLLLYVAAGGGSASETEDEFTEKRAGATVSSSRVGRLRGIHGNLLPCVSASFWQCCAVGRRAASYTNLVDPATGVRPNKLSGRWKRAAITSRATRSAARRLRPSRRSQVRCAITLSPTRDIRRQA